MANSTPKEKKMPINQEYDENYFADPNLDLAAQQAKLARRRELARQMIQSGLKGNSGSGYQGGRVYIVGNPLGNIASGVAGQYMASKTDTDQQALAQQEQQQADAILSGIPQEGPERQQAQLRAMRNPSLRDVIKAQMVGDEAQQTRQFRQQEAEAARLEKSEQDAANRVLKAEEGEANRQNRLDARAVPTVHVTTGGAGKAGIKAPSGYRYNDTGDALEPIPGGPHDPTGKADKPLTENQGNAVLYGARAGEAHKVLDTVGTGYSTIKADMAHATSNTPGVGSMVNAGLSAKEQQVVQAQRDFVNAVMRRESGAAIAPSEFANARKQYFPQPGDSAEVLAQKKANRELVIKGLAEVSGPTGKKAIEAITPKAAPKADTLTPAEQAELDQLRAKHGRK
jgi:hypothetical protein